MRATRSQRLTSKPSDLSSRVTLYEPASPPDLKPSPIPGASTPAKRARPTSPSSDVKPKAKRPSTPKATPFTPALAKPHAAPRNWQLAFDTIKEQRKSLIAAVDTMGCEQGGRERDEDPLSDKARRLSTIVSLMLSSQTKDPVTHAATMNLHRDLEGGLSVESLLDATEEEIDKCICKVGFHATKAMNLKKLAVRLRDLHDGDVPSDLPALLAINGVGPKMSLLYLQAIGINAGIGVDVHVHRITNRLGWHKTATPEQTRVSLESWLPKQHWKEINLMLVGFGQTICKPVGPSCDQCDVAKVSRLCPSKKIVIKKEGSQSPAKRKGVKAEENLKDEEEDAKPKIEVIVEPQEVMVAPPFKPEDEGEAVLEERKVEVEHLVW